MFSSEIRLSALNYLARREHTQLELREKLRKKFVDHKDFNENLLDSVIVELIHDNLVNDERFSEMFIKGRISKGFGPIKIAYELNQKGISSDIIQANLDFDSSIWLEHLRRMKIKKFGNSLPKDIKDKHRQYRYLSQRGYEPEQINKVLESHYG